MFKISNNDFKILQKYKTFLFSLDNLLEGIPRKDMFFKDKIREISFDLLNNIFLCSYATGSLDDYKVVIKSDIAMLAKRYINDTMAYKLGNQLVEINKMVTGWLNTRDSKSL